MVTSKDVLFCHVPFRKRKFQFFGQILRREMTIEGFILIHESFEEKFYNLSFSR